MNRRYLIVVLVAAFMSVISCVQAENISRTFFENDPITRDANVATLVVDINTGEVIDSYHSNRLLPTASTMKVSSHLQMESTWSLSKLCIALMSAMVLLAGLPL